MQPIIKNNIIVEDFTIYLALFKLHKSYLLLISDQEDLGIGNVTLGSPPLIKGLKSSSAYYQLFGLDNKFFSKIVAEKASSLLKAPVLLLLFLKTKKEENEIAKPLMTLLNDTLNKVIKNNSKQNAGSGI
jgi:hypothetical protein